jgi:hypothetical protein
MASLVAFQIHVAVVLFGLTMIVLAVSQTTFLTPFTSFSRASLGS